MTEKLLRSRKIFILGPSHHVRIPGCALTQATVYKTPLYDLRIDHKSNDYLLTIKSIKFFLNTFFF